MPQFRCVIHGSFRRHFDVIQKTHEIFTKAGIEVIAPEKAAIVAYDDDFALLEGQEGKDKRLIELMYLHNLKKLGGEGFSYFVNPEGYIGKSASYELGIAHATNVRCFFSDPLQDHPAYLHKNSIWRPEDLVDYVQEHKQLPEHKVKRNEKQIDQLWGELILPGSVVTVGGIIEYAPRKTVKEKEVLLVKTHKWNNRYSVVGGKVRRNERLAEALVREVKEETGLRAEVGKHLATFDQIKNSGYYQTGVQHIFVDNIVQVASKKVQLNDEAQEYIWVPAKVALKELPIEPNAKHTLELYAQM